MTLSTKDKLLKALRSSVMYRYCCERCSSEYVGSTTRSLLVRSSEHAGRSHRTGNRFSSPPSSNIREHAENCGSPITLDQFSILSECPHNSELRILESIFIHKLAPVMNDHQSAYPLSLLAS